MGRAWAVAGSVAASVAMVAGSAVARQEKQPEKAVEKSEEKVPEVMGANNRRVLDGPATVLAFKNVTVEQLVAFIVEATGKVVMPQQDVLTRRVTVLNDRPIPRQQALDLVFLALQQAGVAVVETEDLITLRDLAEVQKTAVPVIGPEESVLKRTDPGNVMEKVFALHNATAENIGTILKDSIPDYAKLTVDKESNQVIVMGNVGLLKRLERLITSLDAPNAAALTTETFRLRYADSEQVAANIRDLYSAEAPRTGGGQNNQQNPFANFFRGGQGGGPGGQGGGPGGNRPGGGQGGNQGGGTRPGGTGATSPDSALSANLRVSANTQQNSVTVLAERQVLEQIRKQIETFWDRPLPEEAVVPRIYDLKNSDPIKVRDLLEGLFGKGTPGTGTGNQSTTTQGVGRLAGQFSFQAIPEAGRLVVVAKSPDNLAVIDKIVEGLDLPQSVGLPDVVELKHASAEELAEQLNTLLAQDGTLAQIQRAASGLSTSAATASPFAADQTANTTNNQANTNNTTTSANNIAFWWQRSRPPTDKRGASNLIGAIRIVPVWRQNSLMVMAPPEYRASVVQMIEALDKPGRQVLIAGVVCEISRDDATALGLRWAAGPITPNKTDNAFSIGPTGNSTQTITGTKNNLLPSLFDTSVLNVGTNLNLLLQALNEKTGVNILSEPRIFTSDNQEAEFFDGQDIPFITNSQTNAQGNLVQSFDYRAVGIQLKIRPRITVNRDIDLQVNLQLSSIAPGGQSTFGGFIVDRRETTTQLILGDAQTVVISGILRAEDSDVVRKVPLLGDIPLLGALFRSTEKEKKTTELLVFITPLVVENSKERDNLNVPYRERLKSLRDDLGKNDPDAVRPSYDAKPASEGAGPATDGASPTPPMPSEPKVEPKPTPKMDDYRSRN